MGTSLVKYFEIVGQGSIRNLYVFKKDSEETAKAFEINRWRFACLAHD